MFIDQVKVNCQAGKGGDGVVSFRHEKYVPLGGPNGGDGGDGGNVILLADTNKSTLLDLRYKRYLTASDGGNGKIKKMHGARGEDCVVKVPCGTMVYSSDDVLLADLVKDGQSAVIAKGGRGGKGNWHFASSKNPAPDYAEKGDFGEKLAIRLELKVLADAGLVGLPSAGKSTLLAAVSKAKPEIAAYPFTTLSPNLGIVQVADGRSFVLADLPGLIEGAKEGKGLGLEFLRHIERCRVIVHVLDMDPLDQSDPVQNFKLINSELEAYQKELLKRPMLVAANKMDLPNAGENLLKFQTEFPELPLYPVSAINTQGLKNLLYAIMDTLQSVPSKEEVIEQSEEVVYRYTPKMQSFKAVKLGEHLFELSGEAMEKMLYQNRMETTKDFLRLARSLKEIGAEKQLLKLGIQEGDQVRILDYVFNWQADE